MNNRMNAFLASQKPGVTHYVKDLRQAAEWYRDKLGFEIGPHDFISFVELHMEGQYMFHLAPAPAEMRPHPAPVFWFQSRDIERTYNALHTAGLTLGELVWFPDYSSFTFRDPEGNMIAVMQHFEFRVRELEELLLVAIRVVCPDGNDYVTAIPDAARQLKRRLSEISDAVDTHNMIGVFKGDDAAEDEDGYWVCVRVGSFGAVPDGMEAVTVPAQRYAVKWHYGPRSTVWRTYEKLHAWMRESGYAVNSRAWRVEMQRNWGAADESNIEMDLYCPVR